MTTAKVFISYSSKDSKHAVRVCTGLEKRGFRCWVAERNIELGGDFAEEIANTIRASKVLLILFSSHANSSREMPKEIALADHANLLVIPVRIQNVSPSGAFAYQLANRQWIDLFKDWEAGMDRLGARIAREILPERPAFDFGRTTAPARPTDTASPPLPVKTPAIFAARATETKPPLIDTGPTKTSPGSQTPWPLIGGMAGLAVIVVGWFIYGLSATPTQDRPAVAKMAAAPADATIIPPSYRLQRVIAPPISYSVHR